MFFSIEKAEAQSGTGINVSLDSLIFSNDQSVQTWVVEFENKNDTVFDGEIKVFAPVGARFIGTAERELSLAPQEKVFYPFRFVLEKSTSAGELPFKLQVWSEEGKLQAEAISLLQVLPERKVQLFRISEPVLMKHVGDSLRVSAQVLNQGNTEEEIVVTASFPDLKGGRAIEKKSVFLRASQDTTITFTKIITEELLAAPHYTVNIAALYLDGEFIHNLPVSVQNVSGQRTFGSSLSDFVYDSFSSNQISLSSRNLFTPNEAYQINARGNYLLPHGQMNFNMDGYYYTQGINRPLLTNTFLTYQHNKTGVTLGNITENLETYINGRGVKLFREDEEKNQRFEIGWADKSYNLLGDTYSPTGEKSGTLYGTARFGKTAHRQYNGSVLIDRNPFTQEESMLLRNRYLSRSSKDRYWELDIGGGVNRSMEESGESPKPSLAIGNKLNTRIGEYTVSSQNFFSTGYYPGIRRGILQLNERVNRRFGKVNTWAAFNYYNFKPKYWTDHLNNYSNRTSDARTEVGAHFPLRPGLSLSVSAKRTVESGQILYFGNTERERFKMPSFRMSETLSWRSKNREHSVYLTSENGWALSPFTEKAQFQVRTSGTWSYKFMTLTAYGQKGDFNLMEAYRNDQEDASGNYRLSFSAHAQKTFFKKRLNTFLDLSYGKDSFSGNNHIYAAGADFKFSPLFSAFSQIQVYDYRNVAFDYTYTSAQAGVSYKLPDQSVFVGKKKGDIRLFLFYDVNGNGVFDEADSLASNRLVMIDKVSFMTRKDGTVEYKKVPYGEYVLEVPGQEWMARVEPGLQLQQKELKIVVPLQKTERVRGRIRYEYDERTSIDFTPRLAGVEFTLTGNGLNRKVLTNAEGKFTVFIPAGEYELIMDKSGLPDQVHTDFEKETIKIKASQTLELPDIVMKVKQRKIEVKRFGGD